METDTLSDFAIIVDRRLAAPPVRRRRIRSAEGRPAGETDPEAVLLTHLLQSQAPQGIDVAVRRYGEGWLSVLFTGLPPDHDPAHPATAFMARWAEAVRNYYDGPGGSADPVDGSHVRPEGQWETHWQRYQVTHRRGLPYW